jgi:hypothetical protein
MDNRRYFLIAVFEEDLVQDDEHLSDRAEHSFDVLAV